MNRDAGPELFTHNTTTNNKIYLEICQLTYSHISLQWWSETKKTKLINDFKIIIAELHQSGEIFECKEYRRLPSVHAVLFFAQLSDISGNKIKPISSRTIFGKLSTYIVIILKRESVNHKLLFIFLSRYLKQP